jgi:hypothetical protein
MAKRPRPYYPRAHVTEGLVTRGKEWMTEDGTEYIGPYHKYIDGFVMTNSTYNESLSKKLIPYKDQTTDKDSFTYDKIKPIDITKHVSPKSKRITPSEDDLYAGSMKRYIVQRRNDVNQIFEVDDKQFKTLTQSNKGLNGSLYKGIELLWKIKGPEYDIKVGNTIQTPGIIDTNRRTLINAETKLPGISNFLSDLTEFRLL